MNTLAFRDVTFNVQTIKKTIFISSAQLAAALGYANERSVSKLYISNKDEFSSLMVIEPVTDSVSGRQIPRLFSLRGAHLVAMFSRTPVAKEFRRWVLDVLDREVAKPQKPIGKGLKESISEAVKDAVSQTREKPSFPSSDRFLVSFRFGKERIDAVEWDEAILKYTDLPRLIAAPDNRLEPDLLVAIGKACFGRLAQLHGRARERINLTGGKQ